MLPKSIIKASPFHTSCFLTNLKSIHMNYIFHHLYNFGTTGMFVSMGKEAMEPIVNRNGKIVPAKIMNFGIVADERLCDGLYHANSLRLFKRIVENPSMLEENWMLGSGHRLKKAKDPPLAFLFFALSLRFDYQTAFWFLTHGISSDVFPRRKFVVDDFSFVGI